MQETRNQSVHGRRFSLSDLTGIAELFASQIDVSKGTDGRPSFSINLTSSDGTSYEADSVKILAADSDALLRRPVAIEFRFTDYRIDRRAVFRVTQGGSHSDRVQVQGDPQWVRGLFTSICDRINSAEPSESFFTRHAFLVQIIGQTSLGTIMSITLNLMVSGYFKVFGPPHIDPSVIQAISSHWAIRLLAAPPSWIGEPIKWFYRYALGGWPWSYVSAWLKAAYPQVELALGPEHLQTPKKSRNTVNFVAVSLLLPLILSAVYDLSKLL